MDRAHRPTRRPCEHPGHHHSHVGEGLSFVGDRLRLIAQPGDPCEHPGCFDAYV
ncbi:hypothetical protein GQ600_26218 [Phytophthora cactorum]|nr:hypothetical protein GQ600_26218 [Phytophthora cactorum]